jgi:acetyltransferase-like isoleucine patch superfamily enzyme
MFRSGSSREHIGSLERKKGLTQMREPVESNRLLARIYRRMRDSLVKGKYTPYTRAEYLRKCGAQIGEGCFIGPTGIELDINPHHLKIGDHVAIANGVSFAAHDQVHMTFPQREPCSHLEPSVVIGDNCFIGYRAIICPHVHIGPNSVVAAGSVVISDVPPNMLVMGVPARPFGALEKYREKCLARWEQQRPPGAVIEPHETWWTTRHLAANRELLKKHLLALFRKQLA